MPISKNPLEYYRYYCASQRRVEQWVQDTERLSQSSPLLSTSSTTPQWRGFLEDPCLATPISPPLPLDRREPKCEPEKWHLAGVPEHDSQVCRSAPTQEIEGSHYLDHSSSRATSQSRTPSTTAPKGGHDDSSLSQRPRAGSQQLTLVENPVADHATAVPTSSKHSKDSKQSRNTSKSKNSGTSSSKKRRFREDVGGHRSNFGYVPYGIIPLLFAVTTGSSAVSLAAASIMLAGYFCLDYTSTAEKRHSRK